MNLELQLRETIRAQGKSDNTAEVYWQWCRRYFDWCKQQGIGKSVKAELAVEKFLSMLANVEDVSPNTQNQAFSALCYLYRHVLTRPLEGVSALRAKRPEHIRCVLDETELVQLFEELKGVPLLCARMMYASSFRIGELANIRMQDVSFKRCQIIIRGGKGAKDRIVPFPAILHEDVRRQMDSMKVLWRSDVADRLNGVSLPHRFGKKSPRAHLEFAWYYLFCSDHYSKHPVDGHLYRHSADMGHVARQIKEAAIRCGFAKRVTSHCLRHSFATHSVENGVPIHVVQKIMGHVNIETTMGYLHISKKGATSYKTPLETLERLLESPAAMKESRAKAEPPTLATDRPALRVFAG